MSEKNTGGPAFPVWELNGHGKPEMTGFGMDLRDYFAAKAIQGFLSQSHVGPASVEHMGHGWGEDCANDLNAHHVAVAQTLADFSYKVADAMLAARGASSK